MTRLKPSPSQHQTVAPTLTSVGPPPAHVALVVRSLPTATAAERERILEDVEYNVFAFPAGLLTCDFLSDSGTSAMTDLQWAACNNPLTPSNTHQ